MTKPRVPAKRCQVCRFYVPISLSRGECRVNCPMADTQADRAKWMPTEPMSACPSFSRLRARHLDPMTGKDVAGQTLLFETSSDRPEKQS